MTKVRKIELLAPAKNAETGIEAIKHGADAVYIGAPKFSARAAAANTIDDIKQLAEYAHQFGARIYVALNTILKDEELSDTEALIWELYNIGVDALIVQDMGIKILNLPPIALHASTQTDNRDIEKVRFLEKAGFSQIVLARELTLDEIRNISDSVNTPLEFFVHGALCVCYSGQCYLSEAISNRSANRGSCAQLCRLPYTLTDANGKKIVSRKHLLSMKDLNLSNHLEELLEAGVSSLKIEGRLKDIPYVKNTVAYYRKKLDDILAKHPEYVRSSSGKSTYNFEPNLYKSFNRGYTTYFINGRDTDIWSINSPKSIGEPIGEIKEVTNRYFTISTTSQLNNGDGLCFINAKDELQGVRINKIEDNKIYPLDNTIQLQKGMFVYRNFDQEFDKILKRPTAERKIEIHIEIGETDSGFYIQAKDEDGYIINKNFASEKETAIKDQSATIKNNLSKTGNTIFKVTNITTNLSDNWFIPASVLSDWRRQITDLLNAKRVESHIIEKVEHKQTHHAFPVNNLTYLGNVMNQASREFYQQHETTVKESAFEIKHQKDVPLMFTRHCIKYSIGWCPKEVKEKHPYKEPFFIEYENTKLKLFFDCKNCEMQVSIDSQH